MLTGIYLIAMADKSSELTYRGLFDGPKDEFSYHCNWFDAGIEALAS